MIAITASVMGQYLALVMAAGFDAYVAKPISLKLFFAAVDAVLEQKP